MYQVIGHSSQGEYRLLQEKNLHLLADVSACAVEFDTRFWKQKSINNLDFTVFTGDLSGSCFEAFHYQWGDAALKCP